MIAKTQEEKEALKLAKFKHNESVRKDIEIRNKIKNHLSSQPKYTFQSTGILNSEDILQDEYPVYGDYLYVVDDNGGKVIQSDILEGTIKDLKIYLRRHGVKANNIYSCDIFARQTEIK